MKTYLVYLLSCSMVVCTLPRKTRAASVWEGRTTADDAAVPATSPAPLPEKFNSLRHDGWKAAFARSDTTGYEFPEDEEEDHLIRDIVVFVIVSAFVAYFIVKVFLEGDEAEEPQGGGGKDIPPF